jgi:hypothetical protein
MNDETFNLSIRKFLKQFGVGAQRAIEQAVQNGLRNGTLKGHERLETTATLRIGQLDLDFTTEGEVALE